jgi:hypothetical protein
LWFFIFEKWGPGKWRFCQVLKKWSLDPTKSVVENSTFFNEKSIFFVFSKKSRNLKNVKSYCFVTFENDVFEKLNLGTMFLGPLKQTAFDHSCWFSMEKCRYLVENLRSFFQK